MHRPDSVLGQTMAVTIEATAGSVTVLVPLAEWSCMAPVRRVLAIHDAARDVTQGKPFSIVHKQVRG